MRRPLLIGVSILAFAVASAAWPGGVIANQTQPRSADDQGRTAKPRSAPAPEQRAQPRPPAATQRSREAQPRRQAPPPPPPRVVPPAYYAPPHRYYFPPISLHRGYYYHPYFGFYFGPYYGPFYPYPGPFFGPARYAVSAVRTRVKPVETEVYVNGYFAGLVDDFDGVFQRLYLPSGEHEIQFRLDGYETWEQRLYLQPGDTRDVVHQMRRLNPGETPAAVATPGPVPDTWRPALPAPGAEPASPFGILTLHVTPPDAQVFIDGERWLGLEGRTDLVIHVPAGVHQVEVRREGYQNFRTGIELPEGGSTKLDIVLTR